MAYFKAKSIITEEIKEAQMPTVSGKPGWQTTEFWMNLAGQLIVLWGAVKGFVPHQIAMIVTIAATAVYTIARTISKAVTDVQAAKSVSTTVTTSAPVTTVTSPT